MVWLIVFCVATLARAEAISKTGRLKPQRFEDESVNFLKKKEVSFESVVLRTYILILSYYPRSILRPKIPLIRLTTAFFFFFSISKNLTSKVEASVDRSWH